MAKARVWDGPIPGTHEPGFVEPRLREVAVPASLEPLSRAANELHVFTFGECSVLLGHEKVFGEDGLRWHLTISHPRRHPSWDEIKTVRYRLLGPDTVMAMILPEAHMYVNVPEQDHVFQLWQLTGAEVDPWTG
jgi:hypothetical protein